MEEPLKVIKKTTENAENNNEIILVAENKPKNKYNKKTSNDESIVKVKETRGRPKKGTVSRTSCNLQLNVVKQAQKAKILKKSPLITFKGSFMNRKEFQSMFTLFTAKFAADW